MAFVYLVPLGEVTGHILQVIERAVQQTFPLPTRVHDGWPDIQYAFDNVRNQYHVSKLLGDIIKRPPADARKVIGVTQVDLFLPIFTFVFGEAQLNGVGAILSTFRLQSQFYGLPPNPLLLDERVRKEVIHELGHTFGLVHCQDPVCVMRSSTYVEDVDLKSDEFCLPCRRRVNEKLQAR
jgi:archaemetzincin